MPATKKRKVSKVNEDSVKLELIYSDDTQFKYWSSNLFNEVYLRKDLPQKFASVWDCESEKDFQLFLNRLRDLASEYGDNLKNLRKWSETETINNWIKLVLDGLGWANNCSGVQNPFLEETSFNSRGKTYRTDILIVDMPKEKQYINKAKGSDRLVEARESVLMPIEAKYWNRLEQYRQNKKEEKGRRDKKSDDISQASTPNEQTTKYMEILHKTWGMLTDGATWRLFHRDISGEDSERYFEFNLWALIESLLTEENEQDRREVVESAKYFYFFFSKIAHSNGPEGNEPIVDEVLRYSLRYINRVEEDLKWRFVKAMNFACNGLWEACDREGYDIDLESVRNISESSLFNVLFTKSLESRNVLPVNAADYKKISLSSIIDKIERFDPEKDDSVNVRNLKRSFSRGNGNAFDYELKGFEIHDRIIRLTKVIHDGKSAKDDFGFEIEGFRESVFSNEEWKIFNRCKLDNGTWVKILFEIGYAQSDLKNRKYQQIPYGYFTPRQLGSIYESFLEFQILQAESDMVFEKSQWKAVSLKSAKYKNTELPIVRKGELFFTPDNKDRKATGSYYTPDFIVKYILSETLPGSGSLTSKEILRLKVCDPAMGSGHFLVGALNHLTTSYLDALQSESDGDLRLSVPEAKRKVLDSCIFGVDINPRAVKLAKMSLWMESAHINFKLERLKDQLVCADTLSKQKIWSEYNFEERGFDVVIGNPPYIRIQELADQGRDYIDYLKENYQTASSGNFDLYGLFVERGFELLHKKGKLGFIIPNKFMNTTYGSLLRKFFQETSSLDKLVHFGDIQIFNGATTYTCIPICGKEPTDKTEFNVVSDVDVWRKNGECESGDVDINEFDDNDWNVALGPKASLLEKLDSNFSTLKEVTDRIFQGLRTSADKVFILEVISENKNSFVVYSRATEKEYSLEKGLLQKMIKGKGTKPFSLSVIEKVILFPYSVEFLDQSNGLIPESVLKKKYPRTYEYLKENKTELVGREKGKMDGPKWYGYVYPKAVSVMGKPKIFTPDIAARSSFAFDSQGEYFFTGGYGITPVNGYDHHLLLAFLNSNIVSWFVTNTSTPMRGGYFKFESRYIQPAPIPSILQIQKHQKTCSRIAKISMKMCRDKKISEADFREMNELIYKVYGLNADETKLIDLHISRSLEVSAA